MRKLALILFLSILVLSNKSYANFFDLPFESIDGEPLDMSAYKGKTVLVAVTASQCGNTHQFGPLQTMWETYKDKGLVVLGIPSNEFGLEPRKEAAIKEFCDLNYGVDFPMTSLSMVNGKDQHPFFKQVETDLGKNSLPTWNFYKYLVNGEGKVVNMYPTPVQPSDPDFIKEIEKAIGL